MRLEGPITNATPSGFWGGDIFGGGYIRIRGTRLDMGRGGVTFGRLLSSRPRGIARVMKA
jgi:hypothetical protein